MRLVIGGYRDGEVPLPDIPETNPSVKVKLHPRPVDVTYRPPVQVSLGCHFIGAALPHPDPSDTNTFTAGVLKRFAFKPPQPTRQHLRGLRKFTRKFCKRWLVPLRGDSDTSVETWLETCNYPAARKAELLAKWTAIKGCLTPEHFIVKMFEKDEVYAEFKHARAINSRTDEFKCAVGPIFRLIEKIVFALPWFIKKVPLNQRPKYISDRINRLEAIFLATDYSAFEAHFSREMMEAVEFQVYEYMVAALPGGSQWMNLVRTVIGGRNECVNKNLTVYIDATRMSGEMNTSLGNGISNLIFMLYAAQCCGCEDVLGVVEGDDGLFSMRVPAGAKLPDVEFFRTMGLTMKLEVHQKMSTASFCGLVFDETDMKNVTSPLDELASFGYTTSRYAGASRKTLEQLLRCKSFSMVYQYNGAPILSALGMMGLRVTARHGKVGSQQMADLVNRFVTNTYERDTAFEALKEGLPDVTVGMQTRLLVQEKYGIPVGAQLDVEAYLDSITDIREIRFDRLLAMCPTQWRDYYHMYARYSIAADIRHPVGLIPMNCKTSALQRYKDKYGGSAFLKRKR